MAKNNNAKQLYRCTIFSDFGQRTLKGEILLITTGVAIKIKYKKPRSSKYAIKPIPWSRIISYEGETGDTGSVSFKDEKVAMRVVKASVDVDTKTGFMILNTDENEIIMVKPENLDAIADDDIEAPEVDTKKKKDKEKEKKK